MNSPLPLVSLLSLPLGPDESSLDAVEAPLELLPPLELLEPLPPLVLAPEPLLEPLPPLVLAPEPPLEPLPPLVLAPEPPLEPLPPLGPVLVAVDVLVPVAPVDDVVLLVEEPVEEVELDALLDDEPLVVGETCAPLVSSPLQPMSIASGVRMEMAMAGALCKRRGLILYRTPDRLAPVSYPRHQTN